MWLWFTRYSFFEFILFNIVTLVLFYDLESRVHVFLLRWNPSLSTLGLLSHLHKWVSSSHSSFFWLIFVFSLQRFYLFIQFIFAVKLLVRHNCRTAHWVYRNHLNSTFRAELGRQCLVLPSERAKMIIKISDTTLDWAAEISFWAASSCSSVH